MNETKQTPETTIPEDLYKKVMDLPAYMLESIKDRLDKIPLSVLDALVANEPLDRVTMLRYKLPFNRHQKREIAMECLYQHLLLGKDIRKCLYDALRGTNQVDGYLYSLTIGTAEHEEEYIQELSKHLRKDWDFDRLSIVEQAILLVAMQDIKENEIPKAVVINEAVTLAKEYCDDQSYKMINGILDQI
jgi:N utilization substance protein B